MRAQLQRENIAFRLREYELELEVILAVVSQHPVDGGWGLDFLPLTGHNNAAAKKAAVFYATRKILAACARARRSHAILRTFPRSTGNVFCEAETSLRQRQPTDFYVRQIRLLGHRNARRVQAAISSECIVALRYATTHQKCITSMRCPQRNMPLGINALILQLFSPA